MAEKVWTFNGPRMPQIPEASVGAHDLYGEGTVRCFRFGETVTEAEYETLPERGKAKIEQLVAEGFATVGEKE